FFSTAPAASDIYTLSLHDALPILQLELCFGAELLLQDARQLGLFALHPIGMIGRVGDGIEIELRQHTVALAAILELRRNQALCDQRGRGAEPIEHVERGRMERR